MNGTTGDEPKLIFPGLAGFYAAVSDLWYPMVRITVSLALLTHGWPKLMAGPAGPMAAMTRMGFYPPTFFAYASIFLETVGAVCVALGLFTRFFAAALAIQMAIIAFMVQMPQSWARAEIFVISGLLFFAIALRGGGPYSLDRKIGKQL